MKCEGRVRPGGFIGGMSGGEVGSERGRGMAKFARERARYTHRIHEIYLAIVILITINKQIPLK